MPGLSGSDPGHPRGLPSVSVDELAAMLVSEKDPIRRIELMDEYLRRGWKTRKKPTKTARPVKHPGRKVPLAAGVEEPDSDSEWRCHLCQAVTYYRYGEQHLQWHEEERERLLAVAVELLGVLGALDGR